MASFILIYSNFPLWFLSMNRYPDLATSLTFLKMNDCLSHRRHRQMSPHRISWGKWSHRVTCVRVSYLSWLAGKGNTAIFVVFYGWSSFLYQGPVSRAGVEGRDSGPARTDPLCKRALGISNEYLWKVHKVQLGLGIQTLLDVAPIFKRLAILQSVYQCMCLEISKLRHQLKTIIIPFFIHIQI